MKKVLFFAVATILGSMTLASDIGTITLMGTVSQVNEIVITETSSASELDIVEGESGMLVASVAETSNSPTGYTIYMNSVNNSYLVNTSDINEYTPYSISYDGSAFIPLTTADQAVKIVGPLAGLETANSDVYVQVNTYTGAAVGTYTDLITVSIAAN